MGRRRGAALRSQCVDSVFGNASDGRLAARIVCISRPMGRKPAMLDVFTEESGSRALVLPRPHARRTHSGRCVTKPSTPLLLHFGGGRGSQKAARSAEAVSSATAVAVSRFTAVCASTNFSPPALLEYRDWRFSGSFRLRAPVRSCRCHWCCQNPRAAPALLALLEGHLGLWRQFYPTRAGSGG